MIKRKSSLHRTKWSPDPLKAYREQRDHYADFPRCPSPNPVEDVVEVEDRIYTSGEIKLALQLRAEGKYPDDEDIYLVLDWMQIDRWIPMRKFKTNLFVKSPEKVSNDARLHDAYKAAKELRAGGMKLREIAEHLNKEGILTSRGKTWKPQVVRHLLMKGEE